MFQIEDELHAEPEGDFENLLDAIAELKRRSLIPWDQPPNQAPCVGWKDCGRSYEIVEYDDSVHPWREIRRIPVLEVSSAGSKWHPDYFEQSSH